MPQRLSSGEMVATKTLTAVFGAAWLSVPSAFKLMAVFMVFDAVTALFNPAVRFKKRITVLSLSLLLSTMVQIGWYFATQNTGINLGFDLVSGVCTFYSLGSAVDIIINFNAAGVPVPPVLLGILIKAQGLTGKEKEQLQEISDDKGEKK